MDDIQNINRETTNNSFKEDPHELLRKCYERDYYEEICREFPNTGEDGEQILPNRIAMKRRLADFYYSCLLPPSRRRNSILNPTTGNSGTPTIIQNNAQNGGSLFALEKFRDCVPSIVIVKNGDSVMLEPGKVGPLPRSHPFIVRLLRAVDSRRLTAELATVLRKYNASFYDGGCIIGIVDYNTQAGLGGGLGGIGGGLATMGKKPTPIVHKVWLRPTYSSIIATLSHEFLQRDQLQKQKNTQQTEGPPERGSDDFFELESSLLQRLYPKLFLKPDPPIILAKPNLEPSLPIPHINPSFVMSLVGDESVKPSSTRVAADAASTGNNVPFNRLRRFSAIEDFRANKATIDAEPIITADQVVQSIKMGANVNSIASNTYLPSSLQIYRTLQWEKRFETNQPNLYWGLNVYAMHHSPSASSGSSAGSLMRMSQIEFLVFFWHSIESPVILKAASVGESATTASGIRFFNMPFTQRTYFKTLPMVEQYVNQVKRLMALEDCTRRLFNDVYNPNALRFQSMINPLTASNFAGFTGSGGGGGMMQFGGGSGFMRMGYGQGPPGSGLNMPSLDAMPNLNSTHTSTTASPLRSKKKFPPAP